MGNALMQIRLADEIIYDCAPPLTACSVYRMMRSWCGECLVLEGACRHCSCVCIICSAVGEFGTFEILPIAHNVLQGILQLFIIRKFT